jgi:hypothetical protein
MTNSYGSRIDLKFFDETTNGVWPDSVGHYYIDAGQTLSYPLACSPGDQICYGAIDDATAGPTTTNYAGRGNGRGSTQ